MKSKSLLKRGTGGYMNIKRFVLCALCALGMYAPAHAMSPADVGSFKSAFDAQKAIFTNAANSLDERIAAVDTAINVVFDQLLPKASATPFVRFAGFNFEGLTVETAGKNVFKFAQELIKKLYAKRSELVAQKTIAMVKVATDKVTREKDTEKSRELADLTVRKDAEVVAARAAAAAPLQAQITRLSSELVAAQAAEQAALGAKLAAETNSARLTGELSTAQSNLAAERTAKDVIEAARDTARTELARIASAFKSFVENVQGAIVPPLQLGEGNLKKGKLEALQTAMADARTALGEDYKPKDWT